MTCPLAQFVVTLLFTGVVDSIPPPHSESGCNMCSYLYTYYLYVYLAISVDYLPIIQALSCLSSNSSKLFNLNNQIQPCICFQSGTASHNGILNSSQSNSDWFPLRQTVQQKLEAGERARRFVYHVVKRIAIVWNCIDIF